MKKKTRKQLVKQLDDVFSKYIRLRSSVDGYATCVTCGSTKPWKEMQNGHYISRGKYGTRWDEQNCHVQDYSCNVARKGNYTEYARFMIRTYGVDILDTLEYKSKSSPKFSTNELQLLIDEYKEKVDLLLTKYNQ